MTLWKRGIFGDGGEQFFICKMGQKSPTLK